MTAPDPTNPPTGLREWVARLDAIDSGTPIEDAPLPKGSPAEAMREGLAELDYLRVCLAIAERLAAAAKPGEQLQAAIDLAAELAGEVDELRAQRAAEDPIETNIEAAFGEIEELRRQRDDLETNLAAHKARLHRARTERDELRAQRAAALALHAEVRVDSEGYHGCVHCGGDWPCDTRRALGATAEETA